MKLISWNVNGLRACMQKGFADFFAAIFVSSLSLSGPEVSVLSAFIIAAGDGFFNYKSVKFLYFFSSPCAGACR